MDLGELRIGLGLDMDSLDEQLDQLEAREIKLKAGKLNVDRAEFKQTLFVSPELDQRALLDLKREVENIKVYLNTQTAKRQLQDLQDSAVLNPELNFSKFSRQLSKMKAESLEAIKMIEDASIQSVEKEYTVKVKANTDRLVKALYDNSQSHTSAAPKAFKDVFESGKIKIDKGGLFGRAAGGILRGGLEGVGRRTAEITIKPLEDKLFTSLTKAGEAFASRTEKNAKSFYKDAADFLGFQSAKIFTKRIGQLAGEFDPFNYTNIKKRFANAFKVASDAAIDIKVNNTPIREAFKKASKEGTDELTKGSIIAATRFGGTLLKALAPLIKLNREINLQKLAKDIKPGTNLRAITPEGEDGRELTETQIARAVEKGAAVLNIGGFQNQGGNGGFGQEAQLESILGGNAEIITIGNESRDANIFPEELEGALKGIIDILPGITAKQKQESLQNIKGALPANIASLLDAALFKGASLEAQRTVEVIKKLRAEGVEEIFVMGYSGGSFDALDAVNLAERAGIEGVKGVGVGGPILPGFSPESENFENILGTADKFYKGLFNLLDNPVAVDTAYNQYAGRELRDKVTDKDRDTLLYKFLQAAANPKKGDVVGGFARMAGYQGPEGFAPQDAGSAHWFEEYIRSPQFLGQLNKMMPNLFSQFIPNARVNEEGREKNRRGVRSQEILNGPAGQLLTNSSGQVITAYESAVETFKRAIDDGNLQLIKASADSLGNLLGESDPAIKDSLNSLPGPLRDWIDDVRKIIQTISDQDIPVITETVDYGFGEETFERTPSMQELAETDPQKVEELIPVFNQLFEDLDRTVKTFEFISRESDEIANYVTSVDKFVKEAAKENDAFKDIAKQDLTQLKNLQFLKDFSLIEGLSEGVVDQFELLSNYLSFFENALPETNLKTKDSSDLGLVDVSKAKQTDGLKPKKDKSDTSVRISDTEKFLNALESGFEKLEAKADKLAIAIDGLETKLKEIDTSQLEGKLKQFVDNLLGTAEFIKKGSVELRYEMELLRKDIHRLDLDGVYTKLKQFESLDITQLMKDIEDLSQRLRNFSIDYLQRELDFLANDLEAVDFTQLKDQLEETCDRLKELPLVTLADELDELRSSVIMARQAYDENFLKGIQDLIGFVEPEPEVKKPIEVKVDVEQEPQEYVEPSTSVLDVEAQTVEYEAPPELMTKKLPDGFSLFDIPSEQIQKEIGKFKKRLADLNIALSNLDNPDFDKDPRASVPLIDPSLLERDIATLESILRKRGIDPSKGVAAEVIETAAEGAKKGFDFLTEKAREAAEKIQKEANNVDITIDVDAFDEQGQKAGQAGLRGKENFALPQAEVGRVGKNRVKQFIDAVNPWADDSQALSDAEFNDLLSRAKAGAEEKMEAVDKAVSSAFDNDMSLEDILDQGFEADAVADYEQSLINDVNTVTIEMVDTLVIEGLKNVKGLEFLNNTPESDNIKPATSGDVQNVVQAVEEFKTSFKPVSPDVEEVSGGLVLASEAQERFTADLYNSDLGIAIAKPIDKVLDTVENTKNLAQEVKRSAENVENAVVKLVPLVGDAKNAIKDRDQQAKDNVRQRAKVAEARVFARVPGLDDAKKNLKQFGENAKEAGKKVRKLGDNTTRRAARRLGSVGAAQNLALPALPAGVDSLEAAFSNSDFSGPNKRLADAQARIGQLKKELKKDPGNLGLLEEINFRSLQVIRNARQAQEELQALGKQQGFSPELRGRIGNIGTQRANAQKTLNLTRRGLEGTVRQASSDGLSKNDIIRLLTTMQMDRRTTLQQMRKDGTLQADPKSKDIILRSITEIDSFTESLRRMDDAAIANIGRNNDSTITDRINDTFLNLGRNLKVRAETDIAKLRPSTVQASTESIQFAEMPVDVESAKKVVKEIREASLSLVDLAETEVIPRDLSLLIDNLAAASKQAHEAKEAVNELMRAEGLSKQDKGKLRAAKTGLSTQANFLDNEAIPALKVAQGEDLTEDLLKNLVKSLPKLKGLADKGDEVGKFLIQGIAIGLKRYEGKMTGQASDSMNELLAVIRSTLDIRSPSKKTTKVGEQTGEGFLNGWSAMIAPILESVKSLGRGVIKTLDDPSVVAASRKAGEISGSAFAKGAVASVEAGDKAIKAVNKIRKTGSVTGFLDSFKTSFKKSIAEIRKEFPRLDEVAGKFKSFGVEILQTVGIFSIGDLLADQAREGVQSMIELSRARTRLATSLGSEASADNLLASTRKEADTLGLSLRTARDQISQLSAATKGTPLSGIATELSQNLNKAGAALQVDPENQKNAARALAQIAGKGVLSQEEIRQQLGEAIPGVTALLAEAYGVSISKLNKMIESGNLQAVEALPLLSKALDLEFDQEALRASETTLASFVNRVQNSVLKGQEALGGFALKFAPAVKPLLGLFDLVTSNIEILAVLMAGKFATSLAGILIKLGLFPKVLTKGAASMRLFRMNLKKLGRADLKDLSLSGKALAMNLKGSLGVLQGVAAGFIKTVAPAWLLVGAVSALGVAWDGIMGKTDPYTKRLKDAATATRKLLEEQGKLSKEEANKQKGNDNKELANLFGSGFKNVLTLNLGQAIEDAQQFDAIMEGVQDSTFGKDTFSVGGISFGKATLQQREFQQFSIQLADSQELINKLYSEGNKLLANRDSFGRVNYDEARPVLIGLGQQIKALEQYEKAANDGDLAARKFFNKSGGQTTLKQLRDQEKVLKAAALSGGNAAKEFDNLAEKAKRLTKESAALDLQKVTRQLRLLKEGGGSTLAIDVEFSGEELKNAQNAVNNTFLKLQKKVQLLNDPNLIKRLNSPDNLTAENAAEQEKVIKEEISSLEDELTDKRKAYVATQKQAIEAERALKKEIMENSRLSRDNRTGARQARALEGSSAFDLTSGFDKNASKTALRDAKTDLRFLEQNGGTRTEVLNAKKAVTDARISEAKRALEERQAKIENEKKTAQAVLALRKANNLKLVQEGSLTAREAAKRNAQIEKQEMELELKSALENRQRLIRDYAAQPVKDPVAFEGLKADADLEVANAQQALFEKSKEESSQLLEIEKQRLEVQGQIKDRAMDYRTSVLETKNTLASSVDSIKESAESLRTGAISGIIDLLRNTKRFTKDALKIKSPNFRAARQFLAEINGLRRQSGKSLLGLDDVQKRSQRVKLITNLTRERVKIELEAIKRKEASMIREQALQKKLLDFEIMKARIQDERALRQAQLNLKSANLGGDKTEIAQAQLEVQAAEEDIKFNRFGEALQKASLAATQAAEAQTFFSESIGSTNALRSSLFGEDSKGLNNKEFSKLINPELRKINETARGLSNSLRGKKPTLDTGVNQLGSSLGLGVLPDKPSTRADIAKQLGLDPGGIGTKGSEIAAQLNASQSQIEALKNIEAKLPEKGSAEMPERAAGLNNTLEKLSRILSSGKLGQVTTNVTVSGDTQTGDVEKEVYQALTSAFDEISNGI